jgi:hypothetical protein
MTPQTSSVATMRLASALIVGLLLLPPEPGGAYSPSTHREIGAVAVDRSSLDPILKTQYGLDLGAAFLIDGQTVQEWVARGALREDVPPFRALNHFHNPLKPWAQAGGVFGQSSIHWQQAEEQGLGGTWSWSVARRRFLDFLTRPSRSERDAALADTARALGQVMHMVQDAASPAHTRGDPHLIHDGLEERIEEIRASRDASLRARFEALLAAASPIPPMSILTPTGDPLAPAPIARLIDSDTYGSTIQSYVTGPQSGLAEYTNGGYVSDDTIFLEFAFPRRESLGPPFFDPEAGLPGARRYFPKATDGDAVPHFVAEGALYERLLFRGRTGGFILDDKVYEDYAARLLPRAVGYSAALLNYFFRSNLEVAIDVSPNDPAKRVMTVSVPPLLSAETMDGTFSLYADDQGGQRTAVPGASITTTLPRGASAQALFSPPAGVRAYVLAFQGRLGNEAGAVVGRVKPASPFVFVVQSTADLTAEEQREHVIEIDDAASFRAVTRRSKDARKQRARGTFFSAATATPGQHLKRVSLEFDSRMVGGAPVQLLLDDVDVGVAWDRTTSSVQNPSRWEIRVDLPALYGGFGGVLVPNLPRFVVSETADGVRTKTPLVWWRSVSSLAEATAGRQSGGGCPSEFQCEEVVSHGTTLQGLVFFGDGNGEGRDRTSAGQRHPLTAEHTSVGFVPVGAIAGHAVGTAAQTGNLGCFADCVPTASCSTSTVNVFAGLALEGQVWAKDEFFVGHANLAGARTSPTACVRPSAAEPVAPDLPEVRFRRDYLPVEQSRFQEFAVTPPEYEITLK